MILERQRAGEKDRGETAVHTLGPVLRREPGIVAASPAEAHLFNEYSHKIYNLQEISRFAYLANPIRMFRCSFCDL